MQFIFLYIKSYIYLTITSQAIYIFFWAKNRFYLGMLILLISWKCRASAIQQVFVGMFGSRVTFSLNFSNGINWKQVNPSPYMHKWNQIHLKWMDDLIMQFCHPFLVGHTAGRSEQASKRTSNKSYFSLYSARTSSVSPGNKEHVYNSFLILISRCLRF